MLQKVQLTRVKNRDVFFPYIAEKKKTFSFKRGINCIIGPNASGKTTILNGLCWLDSPKAGINTVNIPAPADYNYSYSTLFSQDIPQDRIIRYEPQSYSRFNTDNISSAFSTGDIQLGLRLGMFRGSEGECGSLYFSKWFNQHKATLASEHTIVIADEIENSNDYSVVRAILKTFRSWTEHNKNLQILIATHSPLVIPFADNVVELRRGYLKDMKAAYAKVV